MSKADVLRRFEEDLADPGSTKSGEFLEEHVLASVRRALELGQREGIIRVLRDWLGERSEPRTMLAVAIVRELELVELRQELHALKSDVEEGRAFIPFYARQVQAALLAIE